MNAQHNAASERTTVHARIDKMTRALRVLGAILLLTSASSFLVHRWDSGHDLLRFVFLLCHSFVILGAALFCSGKLGESRSARVFLWTNLAMIPAHFAVLGGLVYSQFSLDAATLDLPSYAVWEAPNQLSAVLAIAGTLLTVIPTGLISARVLAPRRAKMVTLLFVGLCSLLLVPLRLTDAAAILASSGALLALYVDRKIFSKDYRMRTREGLMVRWLMAVPSVMLVTRAAVFYPTTAVFTGLLIMVAGAIGFLLAREIKNNKASIEAGEWLSTLGGTVGLIFVLSGTNAFSVFGLLALLGAPALLLLASRFSKSGRGNFEAGAGVTAVVVSAVALIDHSHIPQGICAVVVGTAVLAYSILMGRALVAGIAGVSVLGGVGVIFERAIGFEHLANWGTLSAMGILAVVVAALLERNRDAVIQRVLSRFSAKREEGETEEHGVTRVDYSPSTQVTQA